MKKMPMIALLTMALGLLIARGWASVIYDPHETDGPGEGKACGCQWQAGGQQSVKSGFEPSLFDCDVFDWEWDWEGE